jgi:DNA-binding SARP family transcriptional activator/WD40 repeat protein
MGIALLGPTQINGSADLLSRRDRVVLTALALQPGAALMAEQLADALWGDEPPVSWPKVVQGSVMRLRRQLGRDAIETTTAGYRLVLSPDDVDVSAFERLVARGRHFATVHEPQRAVTSFETALGLWRGRPFLEVETWDPAIAEAERLNEVRRAVEEDLVEARLGCGQPVEAVAEAGALVSREGLRERRWTLLALALYRCGRQSEALEVIRRAGTTLRDELGLDPGPELVALERAMLQQDPGLLGVADGPRGTGDTCPYQGLRPFDADTAEFFFGREVEVDTCLERLAEFPLLVVAGPSGSGKSSLVRAGLVPRLRGAGRRVYVLRPGSRPASELTAALASSATAQVLVVDQLEELFVSEAGADDAASFLDQLAALVTGGTQVLVTLRADQVGGLAASPAFAGLAQRGLLLLTPPDEAALRRAVEAPAHQAGLLLEPGLVDLLVRDTLDAPGGLPLLSHALLETWENRERNVLTVEGYVSTGGIRGAVALSAERLYESLSPQDREVLRTVLLRLVTPLSSGEPVAAAVPSRVFAGTKDGPRLLDLLVRARLVTVAAETATLAHEALVRAWPRLRSWLDEDLDGQRIIRHLQLAADGWDALGRPPDELYRGARLQAALDWRGRSAPVLARVEQAFLEASRQGEDEERRRKEGQLQVQVRQNRQLRLAVAGVAGLLVLALVAGSLAVVNADGARRAADRARLAATQSQAERLAAAALVEPRSDTALLLSRQAVALADTPATRGGLLSNLVRQQGLVRISRPGVSPFTKIRANAVSADGRYLLMNSSDGVFLVDLAMRGLASATQLAGTDTPIVPGPVAQPHLGTGVVAYLAGFVDGGREALLSRSEGSVLAPQGREMVAFNTATGEQVGAAQRLPGSESTLSRFDRPQVSPDGQTVLSVLNRTVRVWHRTTSGWAGPEIVPLPALPPSLPDWDYTRTVSFSADGARAVVQLEILGRPFNLPQYPAVVVDTGSRPRILGPAILPGGDTRRPTAVALSSDGSTLAVGDHDGWVELRDLSAVRRPTERIPGSSAVSALGWSADGGRIVVGHDDGSLAVYAQQPLQAVARFGGLGEAVWFTAFRGSTGQLLSQDETGAIAMYSLDGSDQLMQIVPTGRVSAVAVGPSGTVVALGSDDGRVGVYDQRAPTRRLRTFWLGPYPKPDPTDDPAAHRTVSALAITADGSAIIAGDRVGHLKMWSLRDGRLLWSRADVPTSYLAVSPDGTRLATSGFRQEPADRNADGKSIATRFTLWNLRTREALVTNDFHDDVNFDVDARLAPPKPRALSFSPDSRLVAAGFSGDPKFPTFVYDVGHRVRIASLPVAASSLTFSPDGSELLVRDGNGVIAGFDPRTARQVERFPAPAGGDSHLVFSADHEWLIGSSSTALDVWDAQSHNRVLSQLHLPADATNDALPMAATSDGRLFVATQTALVDIDFDSTHWARIACDLAGRAFTDAELQQYLPGQSTADPCRA